MKKNLSYKDKLIELAQIYDVKEIKDYLKRNKELTTGQLELILRKNKIAIPKDFKTSFLKENLYKPLNKVSRQIDDLKDDSSKKAAKFSRHVVYLKEDSARAISNFFYNTWRSIGKVGLAALNVLPLIGKTFYDFFGDFLTKIFNTIYEQQINKKKVGQSLVAIFIIVGIFTVIFSGISAFNEHEKQIVKKEIEKTQPKIKKEEKKSNLKVKKEVQKSKPEFKKKAKVPEMILPDLNLKTATVLNLFDDVDYNLNNVRNEKVVKPIYFTQFPKDLDEIKDTKLKKDTFIKIVLPLVVAENEKILNDKIKLKKITSKKMTSDKEKSWLRLKLREYKVKNSDIIELDRRIDIIPVSIALAQAAKESGWGTSRFALEGNAIFGQWTWTGQGIEPLDKGKHENHKILRFPILRASVKAYQNNLNTHKGYSEFREKRHRIRKRNKSIRGLDLTDTLDRYAQTGKEYTDILEQIIKQNDLSDFETVQLTNSVVKKDIQL